MNNGICPNLSCKLIQVLVHIFPIFTIIHITTAGVLLLLCLKVIVMLVSLIR
jgi:hypothetical protein